MQQETRNTNFLAHTYDTQIFFAPKTIPGAPWIYPENLEALGTPIPDLYANKPTYMHTKRILICIICDFAFYFDLCYSPEYLT